jgi:hypothetical protein
MWITPKMHLEARSVRRVCHGWREAELIPAEIFDHLSVMVVGLGCAEFEIKCEEVRRSGGALTTPESPFYN